VIVFGIDPGLNATGYGVIERSGNRLTPLDLGVIRSGSGELPERLARIFTALGEKLDEWTPEIVGIEDIFTGKNYRGALLLGHARGAAILAVARRGTPLHQYPAAVVKQAVVGNGRAAKEQGNYMVRRLLQLPDDKIASDAADALSIAICTVFRNEGIGMMSLSGSR